MKKNWLLTLATLLLIAMAIVGVYYGKRQPTLFLPLNTNLADATRYAFLSEENQAAALVVDLQERKTLGQLQLATPADFVQIDPVTGTLYYAHNTTVTAQNLTNGERKTQTLPENIKQLVFSRAGLIVASRDHISQLHPRTLEIQRTITTTAPVLTIHNRPLANDWLAVLTPPATFLEPSGKTTALPVNSVGLTAFSPDESVLAFVGQSKEGSYATLWSPNEKTTLEQIPFSTHGLHPFIDNRSQHVYFIDTEGRGIQFDLNTTNPPRRFDILKNAQDLAVGFLDSRLIIRSQDEVQIIDTDTLSPIRQFSIPKSNGLFITADSKYALIGQDNAEVLHHVNLKNGEHLEIGLPKAITPTAIFMGAGNTLCH